MFTQRLLLQGTCECEKEAHGEVKLSPLGASRGRYCVVFAYSDGPVEIETLLYEHN